MPHNRVVRTKYVKKCNGLRTVSGTLDASRNSYLILRLLALSVFNPCRGKFIILLLLIPTPTPWRRVVIQLTGEFRRRN